MKSLLKSKACAWGALLLVVLLIIFTFSMRKASWWMFIDIFFFFMAAFSHMIALTIANLNRPASSKLDSLAMWMLILAVLAFIGEFVALQILF